jgi:RNA polymerase sigma-70 factor (ECF subfamily)
VTAPAAEESRLIDAARRGDEGAFGRLVAPYRSELHAHAYRMLGSVQDAEDALQESLLRAWRGIGRFEGRSSLRSWLYTITTNTSLNLIARRPKRVLPIDHVPATDPRTGPGEPVVESIWIEPYPDEQLGLADGRLSPDARYELRESVELAFVAAVQNLPATQRAVLIMREVLGFSAREVAEALETTVPAVNSLLQRARRALDERLPERTQQVTLRELGDDEVRALVGRYVDAWERNDVDTVMSLLTEDAAIAMPPLASWFGGNPQDMRAFLELYPLSGAWRWRTRVTTANGQPAIGFYAWDEDDGAYLPFALNVLTVRDGRVSDIVAFANRAIDSERREDYHRWVDQPADPGRVEGTFARFGLPDRLD